MLITLNGVFWAESGIYGQAAFLGQSRVAQPIWYALADWF
jgi:hypothetical protein